MVNQYIGRKFFAKGYQWTVKSFDEGHQFPYDCEARDETIEGRWRMNQVTLEFYLQPPVDSDESTRDVTPTKLTDRQLQLIGTVSNQIPPTFDSNAAERIFRGYINNLLAHIAIIEAENIAMRDYLLKTDELYRDVMARQGTTERGEMGRELEELLKFLNENDA